MAGNGKKNGGIIQDGDGISEKFGLPIQFSPSNSVDNRRLFAKGKVCCF